MIKKKFRRAMVIGNPIDTAKGKNLKDLDYHTIENEAIITVLARAVERTLDNKSQPVEVIELAKKLNEALPTHIESYKNKLNNKRQTTLMYTLHQRISELINKIPVGADDALIMTGLTSTLLDNGHNFVSSLLDNQIELHANAGNILEVNYRKNGETSKYKIETTISQNFNKCKTTTDTTKAKKILSVTKNKIIQKAKILHLVNLAGNLDKSIYSTTLEKLKAAYEDDIEEYISETSDSITNITSYINEISKSTQDKDLFIAAMISKLDYTVKIPAVEFLVKETKDIKPAMNLNGEITVEKIKSKLNKCREYTVQCKPFSNQ